MRLYEIALLDPKGRKLRRLFAQAVRKGQAIAEARLALAATPGAARFQIAEV
jgi:hypothetical protein